MKVTENDLIGELSGFPVEVVEKMLEYQVEQGNPENIELFQKRICAAKSSGGFDWDITNEGVVFWSNVISERNFSIFTDMENKTEKKEMVNHPSHYQGEGGLEVIDAMVGIFGKEETKIFCKLNAFKYNCRMSKKGKACEDAEKAEWYLKKYREL